MQIFRMDLTTVSVDVMFYSQVTIKPTVCFAMGHKMCFLKKNMPDKRQ